ncbi:MAG: FtsX-like permease family protein [Pseudomonadota bacterium]
MTALLLPWRMLRRDWRAGELRLLFLALLVAVAGVSAVGFFTDRIAQALQRQANELLGADLALIARHPLPEEFARSAARFNLRTAQTVTFLSMVLAGEKNQLAEIKAVSENYPLRGQLRRAERPFDPGVIAQAPPAPGTAWLDTRLINVLAAPPGGAVTLGTVQFKVDAVLAQEPDRSGDFFSIAPRLLMNIQDLPATELIQPGSRITYRLQMAGAPQDIQNFRAYLQPRLSPGEKLEGVEDARPEVRAALKRAQQFLGLAALVSVLLAGVAVAAAARRYTLRHLDDSAVMRCLGATQGRITHLYVGQMVMLGLAASLAGIVVGYFAQWTLADLLGSLVAAELPAPSWRPVAFGLLIGMVTLLGFVVPPLLALKDVPALRVLRREIDAGKPRTLSAYGLGLLLLSGLMLWQAGDLKLGVYIILGTAGALLFLAGAAYAGVAALTALRKRAGVAWRLGLANVARRARSSVTQVLALGVGILALLLLTLVRGDLLASWQGSLPPQAPNRFLINIQPDQRQALREFFARADMPDPALYPMVRGRLTHINNRPVTARDYTDDHAARMVEREFNLSWMSDLPNDNVVVTGSWWAPRDYDKKFFSVEEGIAKTLGIKLGDSLTYLIGGDTFTGVVTNLRKVDWDTFHVNFFVIAAPQVLQDYPASFITSFYLPERRAEFLSKLVQAFPNVTVIDVAAIMAQVRRIIERVTLAVEYVFLFTVLAGLLVLYAAIQSTQDERRLESAILRTLGASRRQLLQGLVAEFTLLGLLSGLVAALAASLLGYVLAERVLHLPYTFNPWLWLAGVLFGVLTVGVVGWWGTRAVLRRPPLQTLREI